MGDRTQYAGLLCIEFNMVLRKVMPKTISEKYLLWIVFLLIITQQSLINLPNVYPSYLPQEFDI